MPKQLRGIHENRTSFTDKKQLPGWTITWQMGRAANGQLVVSELRIVRTPNHRLIKKAVPGSKAWQALARELFNPVIPESGITTAMLRRVRLGSPTRAGRLAIASDKWPVRLRQSRPRRSVGRPETIGYQWWKQLDASYSELRRQQRRDYAKVLAIKFGLSRPVMRARISRGIQKGLITGDYFPPATATRLQPPNAKN